MFAISIPRRATGGWLFGLGLCSLFICWQAWQGADAQAGGQRSEAQGVWIGTDAQGTHFMETLVPDVSGTHGAFHINTIDGVFTLGALFPDAQQSKAGTRGEYVRIAPGVYRFKGIQHVVRNVDGGPGQEIVYISILEGVSAVEGDTQQIRFRVEFFTPDSDADDDGIPDPGAEPFLVVPETRSTLKRFGV